MAQEMQDKEFNLDRFSDGWDEFTARHARMKRDKVWIEGFKDSVKKLAGDADVLKLHGRQVGTLVPGQLNKTLLAKEQPHIVKEYTRTKTVEVFDEAAFKGELPDMFKRYQASRLTVATDEPKFEGLE